MNINVTIAGKTYSVKIEDLHSRPVKAEVDGQVFEVWPEVTAAQPVQAQSVPAVVSAAKTTAAPTQTAINLQEVRSPLPGVIIAIEVKPGDAVKAGQPLCTLEAMKMKNVIRAGRDGSIAEVHIKTGDQVQHNQLMFTYEG